MSCCRSDVNLQDLDFLGGSETCTPRIGKEDNLTYFYIPGNAAMVTFLGWLYLTLSKVKSDTLTIGDKKVTLNHLVCMYIYYIG